MKIPMRFFLFALALSLVFTNCQSDEEVGQVGSPVAIDYQFKQQITDGLSITFEEVTIDSRCPCEARCVWAGEIGVKITMETNETALTKLFTLEGFAGNSGGVQETDFEGYHIRLLDVLPYPCNGEPDTSADYWIEVLVTG